jgi:hypothetical protein
MVNRTFALIGALLLTIGGVGAIFSASTVNVTVSVSNPNGSCSLANSCSVTASLSNINAGNLPLTVWFNIKDATGQSVDVVSQNSNVGPGASANIVQQIGLLSSGTYTVLVSVVDSTGAPTGSSVSATFNTGSFTLAVYAQANYVTVSPIGSTCSSSGAPICYSYTAGANTAVSITANNATLLANNLVFQCWGIGPLQSFPQGCIKEGTLHMTMTGTIGVTLFTNSTQYINYYEIVPSAFTGATISPSTSIKIYSSTSLGPTSATFTLGSTAGYRLSGWKLVAVNLDASIASGNGTRVSFTYSDIRLNQSTPDLGNYFLEVSAYPLNSIVIQQDNGVPAGTVSVTPTYGTYAVSNGATFTVTASPVSSNYCFTGWLDNGQVGTNSLTYTLTSIKGAHTLEPDVIASTSPGSGCSNVTPPPPGGGGGGGGLGGLGGIWPAVFLGMAGGGVLVLGLAFVPGIAPRRSGG